MSKDFGPVVSVTTEAAAFVVIDSGNILKTTTTERLPEETAFSTTETTIMTNGTNTTEGDFLNTYYTNTTTVPTHDQPFTYGAVIFSAVLLVPMAVFGVIANMITMIVIAKSRTLRSIFNYLLISLCVSDTLSALFSVLPLYRQTWGFDHWQWPKALCKASFAIDAWTTYVTTLHILLFAIFRLISIKWPLTHKKVSVFMIRVIIVVVWAVGFACGFIPYAIMFEDVVRDRNSDGPDATWSHCSLNPAWINEFITYYKVTYPIFVYFPMAAIVILCPTIGIVIKRRRFKSKTGMLIAKNKWYVCRDKSCEQKSALMTSDRRKTLPQNSRLAHHEDKQTESNLRRKERNALLQLGFIAGSFLMGYVPNTAHVIYTTNVAPESMAMRVLEWNLFMMGYIFLRLSECLNPIFYNLASTKMRKETKAFLRSCCCTACTQPACASPPQSNGSTNNPGTTNIALQ